MSERGKNDGEFLDAMKQKTGSAPNSTGDIGRTNKKKQSFSIFVVFLVDFKRESLTVVVGRA